MDGIFASSSSKKFGNSFGYSLAYNKIVKTKNKTGISFSQYSYRTTYDNIDHLGYDPLSLSITAFEQFGAMGSADPWFIAWLNFKLGIGYDWF